MLNVSVSPSRSLALGVKLYSLPFITEVTGAPVIVGEVFTAFAGAGGAG
jgi:hypothetical protein